MLLLNRTQCSALRGIAIIGIFLHNYLHWLGPMVKENEYQFFQHNVDRMYYEVMHPIEDLMYHLISFFGHYGVPVFLFLSGYGLVLKYESSSAECKVQSSKLNMQSGKCNLTSHSVLCTQHFIWSHYKKLFPMFLLGFVVFAMVDWITPGHHHWTWFDIVTQLTMTINIFPEPDHIIWPGPYWFFGLMMELYIVYRVLLYKRHWLWTAGLIVICWLLQECCFGEPDGEALNRIRYNFIGGMLPFGMGLLAARFQDVSEGFRLHVSRGVDFLVLVVSLLAVCVGSLWFQTWLWVPAFIVTLHIAFIRLIPQSWLMPLDWMGALSAAIFVCHPVTRKIFIPISRHGDILDGLVLYIVATILLAMVYRMIIKALKQHT